MREAGRWWRHAAVLSVVTALSGVAWISVVPPFEGPDELHFYNRARDYAAHPERREGLFYRLAAPVLRSMRSTSAVLAPQYNPAFQFVSNARGEVNRFVHERPVAQREHVRALLALRGLVVALNLATVLMIYASARLALGDEKTALLVAVICLSIPQFSFINAVVHPEAITRLLAAAVTTVVVAQATGAWPLWFGRVLLPASIAAVPLADRQALFLVPFAALSLIVCERTWRARAIAAGLVIVPAAAAAWLVMHYTEAGTNLAPWLGLLANPLRPFLALDPIRGYFPPGWPYYAFEFVPKMFMGFWGWMGQPSILLPAWMYAALAILSGLALAGLLLRLRHHEPVSDEEARRRIARRLLAAGIVLMCLPIVYGPAIAGRNLWYGRWLFAMLGPMVIGLVLGIGEIADMARRWPHRVAAVLGLVALCASALWLDGPGDALRTAIMANHYGDRARLVATVRDCIGALAVAAVVIELAAHAPAPAWSRLPALPALLVGAAVVNIVVLAGLVRPLYASLSADEYAALVSKYMETQSVGRAADLYASAIKSYPESPAIRRLADNTPRLLLGGPPDASRALLQDRLARGKGLEDWDALLMLAHEMRGRSAEWRHSETLAAALAAAERRPDLAEAAALARLSLSGAFTDRDASRIPLDAGHGTRLDVPANNDVIFEGFTVHAFARGTQVILYFRAHGDTTNSRLWMHAYREGATDYLDIEPSIVSSPWPSGELLWAAFDLPPGRFNTSVGVWVGNDIGRGTPIGVIP